MYDLIVRLALEAVNNGVAVAGIHLNNPCHTVTSFGSKESSSGTRERVEDDIPSIGAVLDCIYD
jgi:hypothetical protein